jgi:hypothetical protein
MRSGRTPTTGRVATWWRRWRGIAGAGVAAALVASAVLWWSHEPRVSRGAGPLAQEAYVWQRAWTGPVADAVRGHGPSFSRIVALGAEVWWPPGPPTGPPAVTRVRLRADALGEVARAGVGIGIALRIGPYRGSFDPGDAGDAVGRLLRDTALAVVADAEAGGLAPAELQLDFDAAESQLDGYRAWVESIRGALGERHPRVPVTLTALPSWLRHRAFARLARASDGFVLQVHSLERPAHADAPLALADPAAARRWVEQAAQAGVPFRVALPTHGYRLAFDGHGRFLGAAAEQGAIAAVRGRGGAVREARADPEAMAGLVRGWTAGPAGRPAPLRGIIWYRLPTRDDELNWAWPTLAAVMGGRAPRGDLRAEVRAVEPGLVEVDVVNAGEADVPLDAPGLGVVVRWSAPDSAPRAGLVAMDAVGGFDGRPDGRDASLRLAPAGGGRGLRLGPGERRLVSWLRFSSAVPVTAHVEPAD